jgi:hypothetical protein
LLGFPDRRISDYPTKVPGNLHENAALEAKQPRNWDIDIG